MIATGLLATAVGIAIQSVREILTPHQAPAPFTLVVLVLVVVIERGAVSLSVAHGRIDRQQGDARPTPGTIAAIRSHRWPRSSEFRSRSSGGKGYEPADDWAALFAAGVIAFNGVRLFRTAWREIMDASLPEAIVDDIREIARRVDGVAGIDMCRVRKSGLGLWVDIHVEVHGDMTVRDGHEIAHRVKDALLASKHNVMDARRAHRTGRRNAAADWLGKTNRRGPVGRMIQSCWPRRFGI